MVRHALFVALVLASSTGRATASPFAGFVDGTVGVSAPLADDRYTGLLDAGPQVGAHVGALVQLRPAGAATEPRILFGLDLGATHAWMRTDNADDDTGFTHTRLTAGPRLAFQFPRAELFARAGVGVDRVHMDATQVLEALCGDPTVQSPVFDGGVGAGLVLHRVVIGGQIGLAVSDHAGDRPVCKPVSGQVVVVDVLDTRDVDLDVQLFVGVRL